MPQAVPHLTGAEIPSLSPPLVYMYHSVTPYEVDPYLVTVRPQRFDQQLRWLSRRGLKGVCMRELLAARRAGSGAGLVGLTFDDGYADFASYAVPIMERYGFSATVFPIAARLGGDNEWDPEGPRKPLMTAEQVRQVADAGMEVGSHGMHHVSLLSVADAELARELRDSRAALQDVSGQEVAGFCYPYGHVDSRAVRAVRSAGYGYGCAIWRSALTGRYALPRTFVGDDDSAARLWAKGARHRLGWGHRGPAASLSGGHQALLAWPGP
jgi:peptidoglycan/xylan/chitin deacetylase (PgdA/CDA1 family)